MLYPILYFHLQLVVSTWEMYSIFKALNTKDGVSLSFFLILLFVREPLNKLN